MSRNGTPFNIIANSVKPNKRGFMPTGTDAFYQGAQRAAHYVEAYFNLVAQVAQPIIPFNEKRVNANEILQESTR